MSKIASAVNLLPHNTDGWENKKYPIIREAVAYIIQGVIGFNKNRCQFSDLAEAMNNIAGLSKRGDIVPIEEKCIKCAFANGGLTEYVVDCKGDNLTDFSGVLHVRIGHRVGSSSGTRLRINDFCLFSNMDDAKKGAATIAHNPNNSSVTMLASAFSRRSFDSALFPNDLNCRLLKFAKDAKKNSENKKAKRELTNVSRKRNKETYEVRAEQKKRKSSIGDEDLTTTIHTLRRQLAKQHIMLKDAEQMWYMKTEELSRARQHYQLMKDEYVTVKQSLLLVDSSTKDEENDPKSPTGIEDDQNKNDKDISLDNKKWRLDYFYHGRIGSLELRSNTGYGFSEADLMRGIQEDFEDYDDNDGNGTGVLLNIADDDNDDDDDGAEMEMPRLMDLRSS